MSKEKRHAIILEGPPLCGKGTQAKKLSKVFQYFHINPGEILRREPLYSEIHEIVKSGNLVDDDIVIDAVFAEIPAEIPPRIIFDGFPRSIAQARWLEGMLKENGFRMCVIMMNASDDTLIDRLKKRQKDEARGDDTQESFKRRLKSYKVYGQEIRNYFRTRAYNFHIYEVEAELDSAGVSKQLSSITMNEINSMNVAKTWANSSCSIQS